MANPLINNVHGTKSHLKDLWFLSETALSTQGIISSNFQLTFLKILPTMKIDFCSCPPHFDVCYEMHQMELKMLRHENKFQNLEAKKSAFL